MQKDKWLERNGRQYLQDVLPLKTPFSIQLEPTQVCNFKCIYCIHSSDEIDKNELKTMSLDKFYVIKNQIKQFPDKLKTMLFCGYGEPLLNKDLAQMIKESKEFADETVLITNGALLTPEKSDELINAGLDVLRISLQGINENDYYDICGVKLNFEKFLSNIKYFFEHKKQCKVFLKAPDLSINSPEKLQKLHEIYEKICDEILVQVISPLQAGVDYSKVNIDYEKTVYNNELKTAPKVCPQPFYTMLIRADGSVAPCCNVVKSCWSLNKQTVMEIWNDKDMQDLRIELLKKQYLNIPVCNNCNYLTYIDNDYDNIDKGAQQLIVKYES